ncbi:mechanosensitive ion channel protein MscS [Reichenbachiella sp. 5M10]|uniref:mechanosensitive ion channel family protein n=1 Tax=Reichenbachiella sp. 5M10 TaxID=1889772 RepID=UPI000C15120B|nr:mechanosensitive ion channel domain-containing protein [Reichenbachiella sp. 5M10]PIB35139.1 mechanosensitive ion channel protein MscS [Reichenbachiella sp. 5M10]
MMKRIGLLMTCCMLSVSLAWGQGRDTVVVVLDTGSHLSKVAVDTLSSMESVENEAEKIVKSRPNVEDFVSFAEVFWTLVIFAMGYLFIRFTSRILELFAEKSTRYRITIKSLIPVIKIVSWILVITIIIMGVFEPPAATILAFSASIGVAVGFASQDILKNIFGGVMILFDRPFNSGDKIEVGEHYGEVVEIGLRSTRILTPDDSIVSIPNGEIMNKAVSNANSGEPNCQVVAEIYLPIEADTVRVREIATQAAQVSKYVYINKPIVVIFLNEIKEKQSVLKMRLKAYVLDIRDEFKFKSEMTEIVIRKLIEADVIHRSQK